jgi:hypothetical protein
MAPTYTVSRDAAFFGASDVGLDAADLSAFDDEQLSRRIEMCGLQMLAADKLGMREERRRWYDEEAAALRERNRRPHLVRKMEEERGLAQ